MIIPGRENKRPSPTVYIKLPTVLVREKSLSINKDGNREGQRANNIQKEPKFDDINGRASHVLFKYRFHSLMYACARARNII